MKKIFLFIGLTVMTFGAFAEKVPSVIVNKGNGGWTALLNLYNYVTFTPAELSASGVGQLDCTGSGFTACRVPNCVSLLVNNGNAVINITDAGKLASFQLAINEVIEKFEKAQAQAQAQQQSGSGIKAGAIPSTYTKTLAFSSNSNHYGKSKQESYVVRGVVTANSGNNSTMKIYIEKVDVFSLASSN